jgi:phenylalanyl-tRNA synthetase beta chain
VRVPVSWLLEHVDLAEQPSADDLAEALIRVGFEVEDVALLEPVTGPLVVGRVLEIEELTEFKKPIRFCRVDVGSSAAPPTSPSGTSSSPRCPARRCPAGSGSPPARPTGASPTG